MEQKNNLLIGRIKVSNLSEEDKLELIEQLSKNDIDKFLKNLFLILKVSKEALQLFGNDFLE